MANTVENLITKIKSLPVKTQRGISAIIGATVADAATRPLHWVYKQPTLDATISESTTPEFWPESKSPFYTLPLGATSNYNDVAVSSLTSLYENGGELNMKHLCETFKKDFGPGTIYEEALTRRPTDRSKLPMEGHWLHKGVILFLENYATRGEIKNLGDSTHNESDGFCAALPIIVKHAGSDDMWEQASKAAMLLNTNPKILNMFEAGALLISNHILGEEEAFSKVTNVVKDKLPDVYELMVEVEEAKSMPFITTVAQFGKACYLPGSFQGALLAMQQTSSFVDAVRLNIRAGGCNCSRSNLIGACYGAKYGIDGIPIDWLKKVKNIENTMEKAIQLLNA
ncbi:crystallin J1A-like [Clytia hemisphaerica]|uniref:Uncharacterized protein n=1 Tax=Clytia hemisphaerica TaxID=252671 RepID=A0A7M5WQI4_9CNID